MTTTKGINMTKQVQHVDKLGRELQVGDVVAFASFYTGMTIGRVDRLKKVRATIVALSDSRKPWYHDSPEDINSNSLVKLDSRDVSFFLLKNK
jgi:hypothetical protein